MGNKNEPRAGNPFLKAVAWISVAIFLAGCGGGGGSAGPGSKSQPSATLSYPSTALVFTVGTAIAPVAATASQELSSFTVAPTLPSGLSLNPANGTISGTPTAVSAAATYTITASGGGASANASVSITVNAAAPSSPSYGAAALTFTTNVAARSLTPSVSGGAVTGWTISPALPAGLTFDATNGTISGTPTAASQASNYVVTAQNSGGQATVTLAIEVDSGVLLDLGHDTGIAVLLMSGSSVLSVDYSGHWNLWDYSSGSEIASGDIVCPAIPVDQFCRNVAQMAGGTVVLATQSGFEVLSATNGQVLASITANTAIVNWWTLASDGSYLAAGSSGGLSVWSPTGKSLASPSGDYSKAIALAGPGEIQIADGPAGQNLVQTVAVPGGAATTGAAFSGQFSAWFPDGSRFVTTAGSTALVYSQAGVQQAAITLPSGAGPVAGQGNWVWTLVGGGAVNGTLDVFAIANGSAPVASFTAATAIPSAATVGVQEVGSLDFGIVDLSGSTPTEIFYNPPATGGYDTYAGISASQFMLGNSTGVLLDGASLIGGTLRYFDYGMAYSIAGSNASIAVATASGRIVYFDASTLAQEGVISDSATKVLLSSDGSVLAAAGAVGALGLGTSGDGSIKIYSLPGAGLLYTWPYPNSGGVWPQDISLSGSGTVLGQVLFTTNTSNNSYTQEADAATGGSPIFAYTFSSPTAREPPPPVDVSPNGTLIATSTNVPASGQVNPGTNILQNGNLVTAVTGFPIGWIDDGHLLVNTYMITRSGLGYAACSVYSPTGQSTGQCSLPEVKAFQTVTSDTIYALNLAQILSVSTGTVGWTTGDPALLQQGGQYGSWVSAVAGSRVVFVSGTRVLAQGY